MELDAHRLDDGATIDADLCIVGAGPAGIGLAREFLGRDIDVLLLESGGRQPDDAVQVLNEGFVIGDAYAGLRATRYRGIGGTVARWNTPVGGESGAKYVPLDPWDFEPPRNGGLSGWPVAFEELLRFYPRAQEICGLGRFGYEAADGSDPTRPALPDASGLLTTRLYQFGTARPFASIYPRQIRESANIRLCVDATLVGLIARAGPERTVESAEVHSGGRQFTVRAKRFVLAGGAIENSRLLMMSGLGNDLVGCCFMEHPRDHGLTLLPADPGLFSRLEFYDARADGNHRIIGGRLALTENAVRKLGYPNAALTLLPRLREQPSPMGLPQRVASRVRSWFAPPPRGGYGWSSLPDPARWFDGFRIVVNLEQRPSPENRVTPGPTRDPLGLPMPELHWRWRDDEQQEVLHLRSALAAELEAMGLGRVEIDHARPIDANAHHHSGTTRMALDPRDGVVDPDGRVYGTRNLYIAGASVFPTAGFANPTLTIVALAIRMAEHLRQEAGTP